MEYPDNSNRPERRSAIISKELQEYNIRIAALSEVRFAESGSIREETDLYWSGKCSIYRNKSDVAFAIRNGLLQNMSEDPKPLRDRLMTLRLLLAKGRYCTLIAAYALTMTNSATNINYFYDQHDQTVRIIPNSDKIIFQGDFNTKIGQSHSTWPNILGKFGRSKVNTNSRLLLSICIEHQLVITNTCFKHKQVKKKNPGYIQDSNTGIS